jgi:hypothetical protein
MKRKTVVSGALAMVNPTERLRLPHARVGAAGGGNGNVAAVVSKPLYSS